MIFTSTAYQLQQPVNMPLRGVVSFRKKFENAERSCWSEIDVSTRGLRKRVWWPCGSAMETFDNKIIPEIDGLLKNVELGDADLYLRLYMIGSRPSISRPVIMVCCANAQVRAQAEDAIRRSDILQPYPGFGLGSSALPLEQPGLVRTLTDTAEGETEATVSYSYREQDAGHTTMGIGPLVGRRIRILLDPDSVDPPSQRRLATGGAVIRAGGRDFQITACHAIVDRPASPTTLNDLGECSFDGMNDDSGDEDEDSSSSLESVHASRLSSLNRDWHSRLLNRDWHTLGHSWHTLGHSDIHSEPSEDDGQVDSDTSAKFGAPSTSDDHGSTTGPSREVDMQPGKLTISAAALLFKSFDGQNPGLDYALIPISSPPGNHAHWRPNEIKARRAGHQETIQIRGVAGIPTEERRITAVTASRGMTSGLLIPTPMYLRHSGLRQFQRLYPVQIFGSVSLGDSGSVVVDQETQQLYGHIVRGNPGPWFTSVTVYMVSAADVFADLRQRMACAVQLAQSSTIEDTLPERNSRSSPSSVPLGTQAERSDTTDQLSMYPPPRVPTSQPPTTPGPTASDNSPTMSGDRVDNPAEEGSSSAERPTQPRPSSGSTLFSAARAGGSWLGSGYGRRGSPPVPFYTKSDDLDHHRPC
jgi:hypothetical protein